VRALCLLLLAAGPALAQERALNEAFRGEVVRIRGKRVTLRYDFEDPAQLEDFEDGRPPHLLDAGETRARIEKGALVLEGSSALRHRLTGQGRMHARFTLVVQREGNAGTLFTEPAMSHAFVFLDVFDHRFYKDGGLLLAGVGVEDERVKGSALNWRDVARARPESVQKHVRLGEPFEVEVSKHGFRESCRVGGLHRGGSSKDKSLPMPELRFGFWVHETTARFDDLVLTVEPSPTFLELENLALEVKEKDPDVAALKPTALTRRVREAPLSEPAEAALRELARRGPDGWKRIAALVRRFARKQAYAAVPAVRALGAGGEPERLQLLADLHRKVRAPELRFEIALALADGYPAHEKILHAALHLPTKRRLELFRALVARGLPDEVVKTCFRDDLLAAEAREVLRARGTLFGAKELGDLPRVLAKEGHSRRSSLAFLHDFAATRNWDLLRGLAALLGDADREIAEGAHLLLLTVSDKDIQPDTDLWNSWISAQQDRYRPPHVADPGPVAAAILRGRRFLREDVLEDGAAQWPTSPDWPGTKVGATALAVQALRAAGLPRDDPAIAKALKETLLLWPKDGRPALRGDLEGYTYALSILAMALETLDRTGYREIREALAAQIASGQLSNGQWSYYCRRAEQYAGGQGAPKTGDNSNTQYAILGLRSLRRCGVGVDPAVFRKTRAFWLKTRNAYGGWGYGPKGTFEHELSMTAAGISTLAICAERLEGAAALREVVRNERVQVGQRRLGELLLNDGYKGQEIYALYGVERACILTGTRAFNDFDWYREGAEILVRSQKESGAWGDDGVRGVTTGRGYGQAVDTSFALLFLKRSTTGLLGADGTGVVKIPEMRRPSKPR